MKQEMNVLGIDIAKRVFHAIGMDNTGKIVFRKRFSRHDLMPFIAKLPPVVAYLLVADNVSRRLPIRLRGVNQSIISPRNALSGPVPALFACLL